MFGTRVAPERSRRAGSASILAVVMVLAACGGGGEEEATSAGDAAGDCPADEVFQFTVSGTSPADNPSSVQFEQFLTGLQEASDGRLVLDWNPGGDLVPSAEALDALGQGTVDMIIAQGSSHAYLVPLGGWADIPAFTEGYEETLRVFHETEIKDILDEAYQEVNTKLIGLHVFNPYIFVMGPGQEIETVDDFAGKKIRVAGGPQTTAIQALGGAPVTLLPGEFYTSMQSGIVDGFVLPLYTLESYALGELAGSVTLPGLGTAASQHSWMNLDRWNALPDCLKTLIEDYTVDESSEQAAFWEAEEEKAFDYATGLGVEIISMPEEQVEQMLETIVEPISEQFVADNGEAGQRILDIILGEQN